MTTRAGGQRSDGGRDIELGVGRVMNVEEEEGAALRRLIDAARET